MMGVSMQQLHIWLFVVLLFFPSMASGWVRSHQEFPNGRATVITHAFCLDDRTVDIGGFTLPRCDVLTEAQWAARIRNAGERWNNAGSNFRFSFRPATPADDPCEPEPGYIYVALASFTDTNTHPCWAHAEPIQPGFGFRYAGAYQTGGRREGWAWVFLNTDVTDRWRPAIRRMWLTADVAETLTHELGHAVGLGHPEERIPDPPDGQGWPPGETVGSIMGHRLPTFDLAVLRPDDIAGIRALYGVRRGFVAPDPPRARGALENPRPLQAVHGHREGWWNYRIGRGDRGSRNVPGARPRRPVERHSGIGTVYGWVCDANEVLIRISSTVYYLDVTHNTIHGRHAGLSDFQAAYGTERLDTLGVCGDTDNGFSLLVNWNMLDTATYLLPFTTEDENGVPLRFEQWGVSHLLSVYADGRLIDDAFVEAVSLGQEFVRGVGREVIELQDFPILGNRVMLEWSEPAQNFVIVESEKR